MISVPLGVSVVPVFGLYQRLLVLRAQPSSGQRGEHKEEEEGGED